MMLVALIISGNLMMNNADTTVLIPKENAVSIADRYEVLTMPCDKAVEYVFKNVPTVWTDSFYGDGGVIEMTDNVPQLKEGTSGVFYTYENRIVANTAPAVLHELCHYVYRKIHIDEALFNTVKHEWLKRNAVPPMYADYEIDEEIFCRALTDYFLTGNGVGCEQLVTRITEVLNEAI